MSKLRATKPTYDEKRFKAFFYGKAGSGKTTAAIQFPAPYYIDTEKGSEEKEYVDLINAKGGVRFKTSDFEEIYQEVKTLLTEKHEYKTLIIDPLTGVYNQLVDAAERVVGNEYGRHYGEANKKIKRLINLLLRLDMNLIITSHERKEYGEGMKVIDETYDCFKKMDYVFDLVLQIKKQPKQKQRLACIRKSRIAAFPEDETFVFSYEEIAKRYGSSLLEKESISQKLASPDQVKEVKHLIEVLKVDQAIVDKWLDKAQASSFDEMEEVYIIKCIESLKNKIANKEAA